MFQLGASDLHLSVGTPALVRKDGRIQALDPNMPALTDDYLKRLIEPIMPAANLAEFAEKHDTDFAYEVAESRAGFAPTCSPIARGAARCFASSRPRF